MAISWYIIGIMYNFITFNSLNHPMALYVCWRFKLKIILYSQVIITRSLREINICFEICIFEIPNSNLSKLSSREIEKNRLFKFSKLSQLEYV